MYNELLNRLRKHYFSDGELHPSFGEEYLQPNGDIDYRYIAKKYEHKWTAADAKAELMKHFGQITFDHKEPTNEVTREEFLHHYKFGKYKDVRGWITEINRLTDKIITRKKVYEYVYSAVSVATEHTKHAEPYRRN